MSDEPITVIIAGEPVAKARPRFTRKGIAYTPAHVKKFEGHGRLAAQLAMNGRAPIAGPVRAEVIIDLAVPQSWSPSAKLLRWPLAFDRRAGPTATTTSKPRSTRSTASSSPTIAWLSSSSRRRDMRASRSS